MVSNYGIDMGIGGECASSYEDDTPYTPRWQEKFTGVNADLVIHTAREFADNALKTHGRITSDKKNFARLRVGLEL